MKRTLLHSVRVAHYAAKVLNECTENVSSDPLYLAGLLHDIGKIQIPITILNKNGNLTEEEFRIVKLHPLIGANLLRKMNYCEQIIEAVLHHHEHWDGSGYPCGLKGKEIPLYSRILSVADAFEAMTSKRPYKKALPQDLALAELEANAGTQFDPCIVESFLKKVQSGIISTADVSIMKRKPIGYTERMFFLGLKDQKSTSVTNISEIINLLEVTEVPNM